MQINAKLYHPTNNNGQQKLKYNKQEQPKSPPITLNLANLIGVVPKKHNSPFKHKI